MVPAKLPCVKVLAPHTGVDGTQGRHAAGAGAGAGGAGPGAGGELHCDTSSPSDISFRAPVPSSMLTTASLSETVADAGRTDRRVPAAGPDFLANAVRGQQ
jgi:hypothetical protein